MLKWKNITNSLPEGFHESSITELEDYEILGDDIKCIVLSSKMAPWSIYFQYGRMSGVCLGSKDEIKEQLEQIKQDIAEEYERNGMDPSLDFAHAFISKYQPDQMHIPFEYTTGKKGPTAWENVTDTFDEDERNWRGLYMEECDVIGDAVECSLFSSETYSWEIYFSYGRMHGVIYASEEDAWEKREEIMREIEEEYKKSGAEPSDEFGTAFCNKYPIDIMNAYFKWGW